VINELPKGQDGKLPGGAGSGSLPVPGRPTMPPARSDTDLEAGAGGDKARRWGLVTVRRDADGAWSC
jgi:hypothetical protein